jgi:hypothetical protein
MAEPMTLTRTALTLIVQPISYHLLESRKLRKSKSSPASSDGRGAEALPA